MKTYYWRELTTIKRYINKNESDFDKLLESMKPKDNRVERVKITDKNIKINKRINDMINDIDKIID
jgi:hypothetical protein